jgi:hypothetical protein
LAASLRPPPRSHDQQGVSFHPSPGGQFSAVVDSLPPADREHAASSAALIHQRVASVLRFPAVLQQPVRQGGEATGSGPCCRGLLSCGFAIESHPFPTVPGALISMVRMGSPVRFRRGAPPQSSSSGGVRPRSVLCLEGRQLPFARDLPVRFAHCESVRAGSWDQVTAPPGAQPPVRPTRPCGPCAGVNRLSNSRRSSLGQRLGRLRTMLASRPAIPSILRLPAPTRIGGCDCWSCITRSTIDGSGGLSLRPASFLRQRP